jgi:hypothetical protein
MRRRSKTSASKRLERKIGEMVLDMDVLREAAKPYGPLDRKTSDES